MSYLDHKAAPGTAPMNKPQKPNWGDAKTLVAALTGDDTTPVTI